MQRKLWSTQARSDLYLEGHVTGKLQPKCLQHITGMLFHAGVGRGDVERTVLSPVLLALSLGQ